MIRLVAVDMDGTLLDPQGKITDATKKAIYEIQEKGVEFVICTGRHYKDAKEIVEGAGIDCSYICMSGAAIFDTHEECLLNIPLTKEQLEFLISVFEARKVDIDFLTSHGSYCSVTPEEKLQRFLHFLENRALSGALSKKDRDGAIKRVNTMHFLKKPEDILGLDVDIYKICINEIPEDVVISLKEEFLSYPQFAAASSFPTNIEITDIKAQKGYALEAYAKMKGISNSEVMAIGDSDNDLSMFTMDFGYPIAMGNAMDCIKETTKYHTTSNAEDGVACALHKYLLD